jgi:hypothetical protein
MYSTILPAPNACPAPRRCPVCADLAARMRNCFYCRRVRLPSALPDDLCACGASLLPLALPRLRSTCSSPGARALMRDLSLMARRYRRCCMLLNLTTLSRRVRSALYALSVPRRIDAYTFRSRLSLLSRSVCDPHCMAPPSRCAYLPLPSPQAPPDPLCRSYLCLTEPACIPSHLYPIRASSAPPLSLALRPVLASARRSHSLDSAS